jgi:hypothetical protein
LAQLEKGLNPIRVRCLTALRSLGMSKARMKPKMKAHNKVHKRAHTQAQLPSLPWGSALRSSVEPFVAESRSRSRSTSSTRSEAMRPTIASNTKPVALRAEGVAIFQAAHVPTAKAPDEVASTSWGAWPGETIESAEAAAGAGAGAVVTDANADGAALNVRSSANSSSQVSGQSSGSDTSEGALVYCSLCGALNKPDYETCRKCQRQRLY